ncbi:RNA polymerase sigma factor [Tengunoibacter tsumagoiensis]|uniref:RNA polymerase sigma factor n=1 Tax=Tengunoibacter tsumagoiensis TaxID=2014871 RepID=UPI001386AEEB|nr:sigma-70 family RNA polymerase sigma factor [Tengunoibacter tsumagoiensis]
MQQPHSIGMPISQSAGSASELDDAALVVSSQAGDQDAFALLVQRHQRRVFNLVFRMLQQYEEANEVTQEAFLAAWQGLGSFRGDARFSTWLYRIAYNCALRQLEQRKRDGALQTAMQAEQLHHEESVSATIREHERAAAVREHLSTLPAKYRIVLVLRHLQEMTYEEMAEILTMPVGTIKTHLFRARNLLKERIESFEQEWRTRG